MICQGQIAKKASPIIAILLFPIFLNNKYITHKEIQPIIAIGILIEKVFNPKRKIKGIIK